MFSGNAGSDCASLSATSNDAGGVTSAAGDGDDSINQRSRQQSSSHDVTDDAATAVLRARQLIEPPTSPSRHDCHQMNGYDAAAHCYGAGSNNAAAAAAVAANGSYLAPAGAIHALGSHALSSCIPPHYFVASHAPRATTVVFQHAPDVADLYSMQRA